MSVRTPEPRVTLGSIMFWVGELQKLTDKQLEIVRDDLNKIDRQLDSILDYAENPEE